MNQIIGAQLYTLKDHLKTEEDLIAPVFTLNAMMRSMESGKREEVHTFTI